MQAKTQRDRRRQIDTTDGKTDTQVGWYVRRHFERQKDRHRCRQIDRQIDNETVSQTDTYRQIPTDRFRRTACLYR